MLSPSGPAFIRQSNRNPCPQHFGSMARFSFLYFRLGRRQKQTRKVSARTHQHPEPLWEGCRSTQHQQSPPCAHHLTSSPQPGQGTGLSRGAFLSTCAAETPGQREADNLQRAPGPAARAAKDSKTAHEKHRKQEVPLRNQQKK